MKRAVFCAAPLLVALAVPFGGCASAPSAAAVTPPAPPPAEAMCAAPPAPVATTPATPPPAPPGAPVKVQTIEGITEYTLPNGMQVLLFPDNSQDTFVVNVTYKVGSRLEGYGETGMAHLLEHMMFKGAKKYPTVWKDLETRGALNNASTFFDRTNYWEVLPSTKENLDFALDMEADRMVNAFIRREDLDKEFSVVRNEFEIGENNARQILEERMFSTAYLWHNYGKSTIGSRVDIEKVPIPALRAFYEKYYQPDNAVLVIAGKFDEKQALDTITRTFGAIPRPTRVLAPSYTIEPVQDGEREVVLRRVGSVQVVSVLYHTVASSSPDQPALDALGEILTREPAGRLYKSLVKTGLASSVEAHSFPAHDPGVLVISAEVPLGKSADAVEKIILDTVEGLGKVEVTGEEVARYQANAKKRFLLLFTNSKILGTVLSEAVAEGDWRLVFLERDYAAKVDAAQIKRVAATYFTRSNRTVGRFVPEKAPARAPLTEAPDVQAALKGYAGHAAIAEGEVFDSSIANIEKRTERGELSGGLEWALLPKTTRGDAVKVQLVLHYGTEKDFKGHHAAVDFLGEMLMRGTKTHTFQQLKDQLDVLQAQVTIASTNGELHVNVTTQRAHLEAVLALVQEMLRDSTFPAAEFATLQKEKATELEAGRTEPQALAVIELRRRINTHQPDDLMYTPTLDESIARNQAVTVAEIKALAGMLGASDGELVVVGAFDAAAVKAQAEQLFGAWRSPRPYAHIVKKVTSTQAGEIDLDTPDKENAVAAAGLAIAIRDDDPDEPALELFNYVLGGGGFSSRLVERLRQKDGLSYFVGSQLIVDGRDPFGAIVAFALMAPQNAAHGVTDLFEEIKRLLSEPIPAAELAEAKKGYLSAFQLGLSNDDTVATLLQESLELHRGLDFYTKHNASVESATADQVVAAVKRHIKADGFATVVALDKKKAAAAPAAPAPASSGK